MKNLMMILMVMMMPLTLWAANKTGAKAKVPAEAAFDWQAYFKDQYEKEHQASIVADQEAYIGLLQDSHSLEQARDLFGQFFQSSLIEYMRIKKTKIYDGDLKYFPKMKIPVQLRSSQRFVEQAALEMLATILLDENIRDRQETFEKLVVFFYMTTEEGKFPFGVSVNDNQMLISTVASIHNLEGNGSQTYFGLKSDNLIVEILQKLAYRYSNSTETRYQSKCDLEQRANVWLRSFHFSETCVVEAPHWDEQGAVALWYVTTFYDSSDGDINTMRLAKGFDAYWSNPYTKKHDKSRTLRKILKDYSNTYLKR